VYPSKSGNGGPIHRPDKSDTNFATFSAPMAKKGMRIHKYGIAPAENLCVLHCNFIPDRELDFWTDSHVKLDILFYTQKPFNDSHHKKAFDYDEDTVILMEELTLSTLEIFLSKNSDSSSGNSSIASEYYCYEIEADAPQFNYHGPKIKIHKQESPVTICTADTIGTIRS
jgi:hypothetical protein